MMAAQWTGGGGGVQLGLQMLMSARSTQVARLRYSLLMMAEKYWFRGRWMVS